MCCHPRLPSRWQGKLRPPSTVATSLRSIMATSCLAYTYVLIMLPILGFAPWSTLHQTVTLTWSRALIKFQLWALVVAQAMALIRSIHDVMEFMPTDFLSRLCSSLRALRRAQEKLPRLFFSMSYGWLALLKKLVS